MAKHRDHHRASLARRRHGNAVGLAALCGKGKGSQQKAGLGAPLEKKREASRPGRSTQEEKRSQQARSLGVALREKRGGQQAWACVGLAARLPLLGLPRLGLLPVAVSSGQAGPKFGP